MLDKEIDIKKLKMYQDLILEKVLKTNNNSYQLGLCLEYVKVEISIRTINNKIK